MYPEINNDKLKEFLALFIRKLERGRKKVENVDEDNIYKIVNEYSDIIEEQIEIKVHKYGVFINFNSFSNTQQEFKEVLNDMQKYILKEGQAIFGKKIKTYGYFQGYIYFLFNDVFNYSIFKHFNDKLDWNYLVYGLDLDTLKLFVKREDEVKHNAVYAITRSGKTVWLQSILYSALDRELYRQYPNLRPEAVIIEKSMDFDDVVVFKGISYKGSLEGNDVISFKDILQMFFYVDLQYRWRKEVFKKAGAVKLQDYNAMVDKDKQMGIFFVIIDEFQSVLKKFEDKKEDYKFLVSRIAKVTAVYTDAGIYLYGGTQLYGSEKGIPSVISGNIETKLFGRYTNDTDLYNSNIKDTYITTKNIAKGDLLYTQGTEIRMIRAPLPYSLNLLDKIEEARKRNDVELLKKLNVIKFKEIKNTLTNFELKDGIETEEQIQDTIFNANKFMKEYLTNKVENLLKELRDKDIERWFSIDFLEEYGIDTREVSGMERFSFIVLSNIIKTYILETKEAVESGQIPVEFDFGVYKKRLIDSADITSYPLVLAQWIWENYFAKLWKTNIDKGIIKPIEKIINEKLMGGGNTDDEYMKEKIWIQIKKILQNKGAINVTTIQKIMKTGFKEANNLFELLQTNSIIDENGGLIISLKALKELDEDIEDEIINGIELPPKEIQLLDMLETKSMNLFKLAFKKFIKDRQ